MTGGPTISIPWFQWTTGETKTVDVEGGTPGETCTLEMTSEDGSVPSQTDTYDSEGNCSFEVTAPDGWSKAWFSIDPDEWTDDNVRVIG